MEMYSGSPPVFRMNGMPGTLLERAHRKEFWDYVYRAICAFALVQRAFGDAAGSAKIRAFAERFERSRPSGSSTTVSSVTSTRRA